MIKIRKRLLLVEYKGGQFDRENRKMMQVVNRKYKNDASGIDS